MRRFRATGSTNSHSGAEHESRKRQAFERGVTSGMGRLVLPSVTADGESISGNVRGRAVSVRFPVADLAVAVAHGLGYVVNDWLITKVSQPAKIGEHPLRRSTEDVLWLVCDTDDVTATIVCTGERRPGPTS